MSEDGVTLGAGPVRADTSATPTTGVRPVRADEGPD
jgi:hypothetical protein